MNKRGFLATLAAMCVAPFAAKKALAMHTMPPEMESDLNEDEIRLHWINVIQRRANEDGATIERWENWNVSSDGRRAVGMLAYGSRNGQPYTPGFTTIIDEEIDKQGKSGA